MRETAPSASVTCTTSVDFPASAACRRELRCAGRSGLQQAALRGRSTTLEERLRRSRSVKPSESLTATFTGEEPATAGLPLKATAEGLVKGPAGAGPLGQLIVSSTAAICPRISPAGFLRVWTLT
jgi:hypothetical protein